METLAVYIVDAIKLPVAWWMCVHGAVCLGYEGHLRGVRASEGASGCGSSSSASADDTVTQAPLHDIRKTILALFAYTSADAEITVDD